MNEKLLEKKLREKVKALGGLALKFSSVYFTGVPDRFVFMPCGKLWLVELKSSGKGLSPRQQIVIPQFQKLGFEVRVIDSKELLDKFLNEITQ